MGSNFILNFFLLLTTVNFLVLGEQMQTQDENDEMSFEDEYNQYDELSQYDEWSLYPENSKTFKRADENDDSINFINVNGGLIIENIND